MQISLSFDLLAIPRAKGKVRSTILSQIYIYLYIYRREITAYFARLGTRTPWCQSIKFSLWVYFHWMAFRNVIDEMGDGSGSLFTFRFYNFAVVISYESWALIRMKDQETESERKKKREKENENSKEWRLYYDK